MADNAYLQKLQAEWEELKAKAKSKSADTQIWTKDKLDEWDAESSDFENRLQTWSSRTEDEGEEWQEEASGMWAKMKTKWNNFVENVTD